MQNNQIKIPLAPRRYRRVVDEESSSNDEDDENNIEENETIQSVHKKAGTLKQPTKKRKLRDDEGSSKVTTAQLSMIPELKATDWQSLRLKWETWKRMLLNVFELNDEVPQNQKKAILISKGGPMVMRIAFESEKAPKETNEENSQGEKRVFENLLTRCEHQISLHANKVFDMANLMSARQDEKESIEEFLRRLRDMAKLCDLKEKNEEELVKARLLAGSKESKRLQEYSVMMQKSMTAEELATMGASLALIASNEAKQEKSVVDTNVKENEIVAAVGFEGGRQQDFRRRNFEYNNNRRFPNDRRQGWSNRTFNRGQKMSNGRYEKPGFNVQRNQDPCKSCGLSCQQGKCPASGKRCNRCGGMNHYARVCFEKSSTRDQGPRVSNVVPDKVKSESDEDFD